MYTHITTIHYKMNKLNLKRVDKKYKTFINLPQCLLQLLLFVICRYCKLLIQEMELKVDQGFINAMMAMFASSETTDEDERRFFEADLERTRKALVEDLREASANEQKHFYDMLHFSPLKV